MRYSASDKTEIIRLVEQSTLPARRMLEKLGIPRSSFYRWYDRYQRGGPEALADRPSRPDRELCRKIGDGVNQAADLISATASIPSLNFIPLTTFGNWF